MNKVLAIFAASGGEVPGDNWVPITVGSEHFNDVKYFDDLGIYVAVGNAGKIVTSIDGKSWTTRFAPTATMKTFYAISRAPTANGGIIIVVGGYTGIAGSVVYSSTNGITWTSRLNSTEGGSLRSATWNNNANAFIAVGEKGSILTSTNGIAWTRQNIPTRINDITEFNGNTYVVADNGYIGQISYSGSLTIIKPTSANLNSLVSFSSYLIAVGRGGTILRSIDGTTWAVTTSGTTEDLYKIYSSSGTAIVLGANGTILRSTTGTSWTKITNPSKYVNANYRSLIVSNNKFKVMGDNAVIYSKDYGVTWEDLSHYDDLIVATAHAYVDYKSISIAVPQIGGYVKVRSSDTNNNNWYNKSITRSDRSVLTAYKTFVNSGWQSTDRFVIAGSNGYIATSDYDYNTFTIGETWTERTSPISNSIKSIASLSSGTSYKTLSSVAVASGTGSTVSANTYSGVAKDVFFNLSNPALSNDILYNYGLYFDPVTYRLHSIDGLSKTVDTTSKIYDFDSKIASVVTYTIAANSYVETGSWDGMPVGFEISAITSSSANSTGGAIIASSNNGNTWVLSRIGLPNLNKVCYHKSDNISEGIFVAVGENGTIVKANENTGMWESVASGVTSNLVAVYSVYTIGQYKSLILAISNDGVLLQSFDDAVTWEVKQTNLSLIPGVVNDMNYEYILKGKTILQSSGATITDPMDPHYGYLDFAEWKVKTFKASSMVNYIDPNTNASTFVYTSNTASTAAILIADDSGAIPATPRESVATSLNKVIWDDVQLLAVGADGIYTSSDNVTWTNVFYSVGINLTDITKDTYGSTYVAIGANGAIVTYSEGAWSISSSNTTKNLNSIKWSAALSIFVIVGGDSYGVVLYSEDGVNWTTTTETTTGGTCLKVEYGNNKFVAVGPTRIMTSLDGIVWNPTTITEGQYPAFSWNPMVLTGATDVVYNTNSQSWYFLRDRFAHRVDQTMTWSTAVDVGTGCIGLYNKSQYLYAYGDNCVIRIDSNNQRIEIVNNLDISVSSEYKHIAYGSSTDTKYIVGDTTAPITKIDFSGITRFDHKLPFAVFRASSSYIIDNMNKIAMSQIDGRYVKYDSYLLNLNNLTFYSLNIDPYSSVIVIGCNNGNRISLSSTPFRQIPLSTTSAIYAIGNTYACGTDGVILDFTANKTIRTSSNYYKVVVVDPYYNYLTIMGDNVMTTINGSTYTTINAISGVDQSGTVTNYQTPIIKDIALTGNELAVEYPISSNVIYSYTARPNASPYTLIPQANFPSGKVANTIEENGGTYVVAGENGFIARTRNVTSWTTSPQVTTENINGLSLRSYIYVAVGNNGTILYSPP
jgi:hypothetical protein